MKRSSITAANKQQKTLDPKFWRFTQLLDQLGNREDDRWMGRGQKPFLCGLRRKIALWFKKDIFNSIASAQRDVDDFFHTHLPLLQGFLSYLCENAKMAIHEKVCAVLGAIDKFSPIWDEY